MVSCRGTHGDSPRKPLGIKAESRVDAKTLVRMTTLDTPLRTVDDARLSGRPERVSRSPCRTCADQVAPHIYRRVRGMLARLCD